MADYIRTRQHGGSYFFTVVAYQRQPILTDSAVRADLRQSIAEVRAKMPFRIDAWVLLQDHMHCIWTMPESHYNFSKRWGMIKAACSRRLNENAGAYFPKSFSQQRRRENTLWQRRFWEHQIRDQRDLNNHLDYLHYNPVKHGLVSRPEDWPYSSFHRYLNAGFYEQGWGAGENITGDFGE
ncbi:REP-associated tyrosine transposase [Hydrocarboniclastica marina]|uniref:Transposase n=1 Tax=Hydrocarboniclastica marina TaxID=2259620 RepID=A0A4P7XHH3_9ALTE|nr:transposase [Hydrocarboniclastica marina]QCF26476.1 transposase [Hydrocarboniclastica marina]